MKNIVLVIFTIITLLINYSTNIINFSDTKKFFYILLSYEDSNPNPMVQSHLCYRYTIGHFYSRGNMRVRLPKTMIIYCPDFASGMFTTSGGLLTVWTRYSLTQPSSFYHITVARMGVEPTLPQWKLDFKSSASTNSAT